MKIRCMIDNKKFTKKPSGKEIGGIVNRLGKMENILEISALELARDIMLGKSFKPAICGRKQSEWKEQQVFAVDVDEGLNIDEAINKSKELGVVPSFIYTSFSHSEDHNKFRLVFVADKVIKNRTVALQVQNILNKLFGADEHCKNLNRIYYAGKEVVYENYDSVIDVDLIVSKYEGLICEAKGDNLALAKQSDKLKGNNSPLITKNNNNNPTQQQDNINIITIKSLNSDLMKSLLNQGIEYSGGKRWTDITIYNNTDILVHQKPPLVITDEEQLYDYIDKIDLYEFLGVDGDTFNCILPSHEDNNPSAGIIVNDDGHYIYNCFGCGFKGGIIKLIEAISGCTRYHAIKFIKNIFNIVTETEWQKEQKAIIEENIKYLLNGRMETDYPNLWKYIKPRVDKLILLNVYAKENITSEECSVDSYPIFFGSLKYFMDLFKTKSKETTSKTVQLFALLNMIDKVDIDDIPKDMLERAKQQKKKNNQHKLVNHYQIKSYCYTQLHNAEKKAISLKDNSFSMRGLSREWVLRTFGKDVANHIYPQYKKENDKGVSKKSDDKTLDIVNIIVGLINDKGYAVEKEVVEILREKYGKGKTEIQIKRSLQEILDSYDLLRARCNKKIKEQFGVVSNGYPFIIVNNEEKF